MGGIIVYVEIIVFLLLLLSGFVLIIGPRIADVHKAIEIGVVSVMVALLLSSPLILRSYENKSSVIEYESVTIKDCQDNVIVDNEMVKVIEQKNNHIKIEKRSGKVVDISLQDCLIIEREK